MTDLEKEVLRYLGVRGEPGDALLQDVRRCMEIMDSHAQFRTVHRQGPCVLTAEGIVEMEGLRIQSRSLHQHLTGCGQGILLAATLGVEVDRLIHRSFLHSSADAVTLQACAAAYLEQACDVWQEQTVPGGLYARFRFSPGYGDFALDWQGPILQALRASQRIGLSQTASHMLVPSKSITAVLGLASSPSGEEAPARCGGCSKTDCPYRNQGGCCP